MPRESRNPPFVDTDVLTAEECRRGLQLSPAQWYRVAPSLPVSYALGAQSPRYIWGEVLAYLRRTQVGGKAA
jgi:hypothetical protein